MWEQTSLKAGDRRTSGVLHFYLIFNPSFLIRKPKLLTLIPRSSPEKRVYWASRSDQHTERLPFITAPAKRLPSPHFKHRLQCCADFTGVMNSLARGLSQVPWMMVLNSRELHPPAYLSEFSSSIQAPCSIWSWPVVLYHRLSLHEQGDCMLSLPRMVPIDNCQPSTTVNSTPFSLKCPALDSKSYDHPSYRGDNYYPF